jgi:hypothetical protein
LEFYYRNQPADAEKAAAVLIAVAEHPPCAHSWLKTLFNWPNIK